AAGTSVECLPGLVLGTYTVSETGPPTNYAPSENQTVQNRSEDRRVGKAPSATLTLADTQQTGALAVTKTFDVPPPAGTQATFKITGPAPSTAVVGTLTTTTTAAGTSVECLPGLVLGTYTVSETGPPTNYAPSENQTVQN